MWFLILMAGALSYAQSPLEGNWVRPCQSGLTQIQSFKGSKSTAIDHYYKDTSCRLPMMSFVNYGAYSLGSETIDFIFENVAVVLYSENMVADYNRRAICGITTWKVGYAKLVTGRRCAFFQPTKQVLVPKRGDGRYGIWNKETDRLYFGVLDLEYPGTSPDKRPINWDLRPYFKQP